MEKEFHWEKWGVCGLTALLAALTCVLLPISYAVNDDVGLEKILSGWYTGVPDGHAIYIQAVLAYPLTWLYRLFPGLNWYGIFLCGLQWLCLALVLGRAARAAGEENQGLAVASTAVVFLAAVWENYVSVTYTVTAGILLACALYWYLSGEGSVKDQILTALLASIGLALRMQFAPVVLLAGGIAWLSRTCREGIRATWYLPALLGASLLLTACCQRLAYGSTEWQEFLRFNEARTEVYDYTGIPSYEEERGFYEENKISVQVFEALDIYDLTGREEVSEQLLRTVADYQKQKQQLPFREHLGQTLKNAFKSLFADAYGQPLFPVNFLAVAAWVVFFCAAIMRKEYACLSFGWAFLLAMGAMWLYLAWQGRLLYRVLFVLYLMLLAAGAGFLSLCGWKLPPGRAGRRALAFLALGFLVPALYRVSVCCGKALEAERQNQDRDVLEEYFAGHPDQFFFVATPLVAPVCDRISLWTEPSPMNYDELGGWTVRTPLYRQRLQRAGIQDIRGALLSQEACVVTSGRKMAYLFSDEYEEGTRIVYECVEELHGEAWKYYIYRYILQ